MADPIYYPDLVSSDNYNIKIVGRKEIAQGGPVIGKLYINGNPVFSNLYFGGPAIAKSRYLFIPIWEKGFFTRGFRICVVNLETLKIEKLDKKCDVININRVDEEHIFYFKEIENHNHEYRTKYPKI